jgi:hypothetical protein
MHDEIFHSDNHWYAPELGAALQRHAKHDHVEVRVHPYFTDYELWDYLSSITVSVLPYRFGTPLRLAGGMFRSRDRSRRT